MKKQAENTAAENATTRPLEKEQLILYRAELSAADWLLKSGEITTFSHERLYRKIAEAHGISDTSIYYETP